MDIYTRIYTDRLKRLMADIADTIGDVLRKLFRSNTPKNSLAVAVTRTAYDNNYEIHEATGAPKVLTNSGIIIVNYTGTKLIVMEDGTVIPPCSADRNNELRIKRHYVEVEDSNGIVHVYEKQSLPSKFIDDLINKDFSDVDIILMPRQSAAMIAHYVRRNRTNRNPKIKQKANALMKIHKAKIRSLRRVRDKENFDHLLRHHNTDGIYVSNKFLYYPIYDTEMKEAARKAKQQ